MQVESLASALEREHRVIDDRIETFMARPASRDRRQLAGAIETLRRHIYLEEEFLFPALHAAGLVAPVLVMLREHAQIWTTLDWLERELVLDAGSDTALRLCHQLSVQLQHHNLKEEKVLYPRADTALTAPAATRLRTFLGSGELPAGWVCLKART